MIPQTNFSPTLFSIARLLIRPGDSVVVEDPCGYLTRRSIFRINGANLIDVPVDDEGLIVDRLDRFEDKVRLIHVSPSHHDPTGVTLSLDRRLKLIHWARKHEAFILENDFDSEYFYGVPRLPAIQGLGGADLVIYRYTFWRILFPLVRMSIMVLPPTLVPMVKRVKQYLGEAPLLEQKVLADFIADGHFERHLKRTRSSYEQRRVALIQVLTRSLGILPQSDAGMHILARFPAQYSSEQILNCAKESGLPMIDTADYYNSTPPPNNEYLVGFAYHINANELQSAAEKFVRLLKQAIPTA